MRDKQAQKRTRIRTTSRPARCWVGDVMPLQVAMSFCLIIKRCPYPTYVMVSADARTARESKATVVRNRGCQFKSTGCSCADAIVFVEDTVESGSLAGT